MSELKILVEGYAREEEGSELVTCTTTLIRDSGLSIVVDPGMNRPLLERALREEGLGFGDIDYVVLTHTHTDHSLLSALFTRARVIDPWSIYTFDGRIEDHEGRVPGTSVTLLRTPGHDPSHISAIVRTRTWGPLQWPGTCSGGGTARSKRPTGKALWERRTRT